jgi:hypothetical protein
LREIFRFFWLWLRRAVSKIVVFVGAGLKPALHLIHFAQLGWFATGLDLEHYAFHSRRGITQCKNFATQVFIDDLLSGAS